MQAQRRLKLRSRTGCSRCKTRHQKCDEKRPRCSRCRGSAATCVYNKTERKPAAPPRRQSFSLTRGISSGYSAFISFNDPSHSTFLDYFLSNASAAMCCHEAIQQDTCRAVVSVGSVFPSLLYSALLFGALHKASRIHRDVSRKELDIRIMELRASALASLQTELHHRHHDTNGAPVIATTLMLATCELHFDPDASFWRRHFDCASLLMTGSCQGRQTPTDNTELWRLIYRLFSLMDFLISLPAPRSAMSCPITCESRTKELPLVESVGVIDGNLACSRDLLVVFKWIKTLEDIRQVSDHDEILDLGFDSEEYVIRTASQLVDIVHRMMARDETTRAMLSQDLTGHCDEDQTQAYRIANSVAHHIALIYLHRRGLRMDREADVVRGSVDSIIRLAEAMPKREGLHPSIVLSTALFVAGCEATGEARSDIRSLLQIQYDITGNQGAHRTLQKLDALWELTLDGPGNKLTQTFPVVNLDNFVPY